MTGKRQYLPLEIKFCEVKLTDVITTSLPDTNDAYEGEMDWNSNAGEWNMLVQ